MNQIYKKASVMLLACGLSIGTFAQTAEVSPAQGKIDTEINPAGCAGFSLSYTDGASINTNAEGFICLYRGTELLKMVTPQNYAQVQCFSGFDKYTETGDIQVSFYDKASGAPTTVPGEYTVTIPAGIFFCGANKAPNQAQTLHWTMPVSATSLSYSFNPAPGAVKDLSTLVITCSQNVKEVKTEPWTEERDLKDDETGETEHVIDTYYPFAMKRGSVASPVFIVPTSVHVDGKDVILTFDNSEFESNLYYLEIPEGTITLANGSKNGQILEMYKYQAATRGAWDCPITPAEGSYANIPVFETGWDAIPEANIKIVIPAGYTTTMQSPKLYQIVDGQRASKPFVTFTYQIGERRDDSNDVYLLNRVWEGATARVAPVNPPAGEYELVFPAQAFFQGNNRSPEIVYNYTFTGAPVDFTVTPEAGSELYSISTIKVSYTGASLSMLQNEYDPAENSKSHPGCYATISTPLVSYVATVSVDETDPSTAVFKVIGQPISLAGEWTFNCPANYFFVNGANPGTQFELNVINPTVDPAAGSLLKKAENFTLELDATDVVVDATKKATFYALDENGVRTVVVGTLNASPSNDGKSILLTPDQAGSLPLWDGNFELATPAGLFTCSKGEAGNYSYRYVANGSVLESKPGIDPAEGSIKAVPESFVLTVPNATISLVDGNLLSIVYFAEDGQPTGIGQVYYTAEVGEAPGTVVLKLKNGSPSAFLKDDELVLVTPENLFVSSEGAAQSYSFFYKIGDKTAVANIEGVAADYTIYTTTGVRVATNAASMPALQKGIYIINGRKVVIK